MSVTETIVKEHHLIRDFTDKIQAAAEIHGWGEHPPKEFFELSIHFVESFIEKYHHIKEEEILFPMIVKKLEGEIDSQFKALQNQHKTANTALAEVKRCLKGYDEGEPYQTSMFWRNLGTYMNFLRSHLNRENHFFIPLIDRRLSEEEREEVAALFDSKVSKLGKNYLDNCKRTLEQMTKILEKHYGDRYRHILDSVASKRVNYNAA